MNTVTAKQMRSWMLVFLLSLILIIPSFACEFSSKVKGVYSLAGSVTLALRDLDLIKDKKLSGISIFHPVDKKVFKGEILPGGIFLSHDTIKNLKGSVLFYDESREMTRILSGYPEVKSIQIKTRGLSPLAVVESTSKELKPYLENCNLNILQKNLETKLAVLKKVIPPQKTILFFLGQIKQGRYPELLMVNDGVVKWMVEEKLLKSYPSELAYVNWSAKILQSLPSDLMKVGLKDSGSEMGVKLEKSEGHFNLTYPGSLIPGTGQVEAMIYLFQYL